MGVGLIPGLGVRVNVITGGAAVGVGDVSTLTGVAVGVAVSSPVTGIPPPAVPVAAVSVCATAV
jgi:hypothetical protein